MYLVVAVDVFVVLAYFGEKALCGTQHTDAVSSTALRKHTADTQQHSREQRSSALNTAHTGKAHRGTACGSTASQQCRATRNTQHKTAKQHSSAQCVGHTAHWLGVCIALHCNGRTGKMLCCHPAVVCVRPGNNNYCCHPPSLVFSCSDEFHRSVGVCASQSGRNPRVSEFGKNFTNEDRSIKSIDVRLKF